MSSRFLSRDILIVKQKQEWKFGRTKNVSGTRAVSLVDYSVSTVLSNYLGYFPNNIIPLYSNVK